LQATPKYTQLPLLLQASKKQPLLPQNQWLAVAFLLLLDLHKLCFNVNPKYQKRNSFTLSSRPAKSGKNRQK
jgi:hypothetical protein